MNVLLNISVDQTDLSRMQRALTRMEVDARLQQKTLPSRCALDYKNLLVKNILTQKYSMTYPRYSDRYAAWKTQVMLMGSQFWRLYGDLVNAITVFRMGEGYLGGIPANAMDSGGKSWFGTLESPKGRPKPIVMYARTMEFGEGNQPARPVFGPTRDEYAVAGFPMRNREALMRIGRNWR